MRRFSVKRRSGRVGNRIKNQWMSYRGILLGLLVWWGIGTGIGLLFAISLDGNMKQTLAEYLRQGVSQAAENTTPGLTYFLKRCLCYIQLLSLIWGLEFWPYGCIGVRILMMGRGFIYGFSQTAWVAAYGIRGILMGTFAYIPHNFMFAVATGWVEWWMLRKGCGRKVTARVFTVWMLLTVPIIAWAETCWSPNVMKACM